jgi:uncharacterized protein (DUF1697 family)
MKRYAAFLRGVMPTNAKMSDLVACFETAGFSDVKTVLGSGNVVFSAREPSEPAVERKAEKAMCERLGRSFYTIARAIDELEDMLTRDPFAAFKLAPGSKRVVSFMREEPSKKVPLPMERDRARVLAVVGREIFTAYLPSPRGPVFMELIKELLGEQVTTRTWDTLKKVVAAATPANGVKPGPRGKTRVAVK